MTAIKEMKHQTFSLKFAERRPRILDFSDPGTGKTYVHIMNFARRHKKNRKAALVLVPKSLIRAAWGNDIKKFAPHLRASYCYANVRKTALEADADVFIVNHDGVKDLLKYGKKFFEKFDTLIIDESTAFKHHTSGRSKALAKIKGFFPYRACLSGTPTSNGLCDIWNQVYIVDDGKRLGKTFESFRKGVCTPERNDGGFIEWVERDGMELLVSELIRDITIRHKFEDCVDIPPNHTYSIPVQLNKKHEEIYRKLEKDYLLKLKEGKVTAVHGGALAQKLMQVCSGAVYDDDGGYIKIDNERYELTLDLVEARKHSIVFYTWDHQLEELVKEADRRGIKYAIWNPDTPELETQYQAGEFQTLFAHPKSAGHGLTLTKGTATIWPSPTHNLEHFIQGLKRVYRISQIEPTETIVLVAENTVDEIAFDSMTGKGVRMSRLLYELQSRR